VSRLASRSGCFCFMVATPSACDESPDNDRFLDPPQRTLLRVVSKIKTPSKREGGFEKSGCLQAKEWHKTEASA